MSKEFSFICLCNLAVMGALSEFQCMKSILGCEDLPAFVRNGR